MNLVAGQPPLPELGNKRFQDRQTKDLSAEYYPLNPSGNARIFEGIGSDNFIFIWFIELDLTDMAERYLNRIAPKASRETLEPTGSGRATLDTQGNRHRCWSAPGEITRPVHQR